MLLRLERHALPAREDRYLDRRSSEEESYLFLSLGVKGSGSGRNPRVLRTAGASSQGEVHSRTWMALQRGHLLTGRGPGPRGISLGASPFAWSPRINVAMGNSGGHDRARLLTTGPAVDILHDDPPPPSPTIQFHGRDPPGPGASLRGRVGGLGCRDHPPRSIAEPPPAPELPGPRLSEPSTRGRFFPAREGPRLRWPVG